MEVTSILIDKKAELKEYAPNKAGMYPKTWQSVVGPSGTKSKILYRSGNLILVKNQSFDSMGRIAMQWYCLSNIYMNDENIEQISDYNTITNVEKQRDEAFMTKIFLQGVSSLEAKEDRRIREDEQNKIAWELREKNAKIRNELQQSAVHLILEMQDLIDRSESLAGVMANKRIKEIVKTLGEYNIIRQHFKTL